MLPALSVNKGCCSPQAAAAALTVSHEGTEDGDKSAVCCQALSRCSQPSGAPCGTQDGKEQDTGLES